MASATYVKFYDFVEQFCKGLHHFDAGGDTFEVYLTNVVPDVATDVNEGDLAQATAENGGTWPTDIVNDVSETSGTATVVAGVDSVTYTATAGGFGPVRYAVVMNQTATGNPLVCYWDYGSSETPAEGETFTIDFGASLFAIS